MKYQEKGGVLRFIFVWLVMLNKTGNTGGTGFMAGGGNELSFRHTWYEILDRAERWNYWGDLDMILIPGQKCALR